MNRDTVTQELMPDYREDCARFWRSQFAWLALIGIAVIFPLTYFVLSYFIESGAGTDHLGLTWWQGGLVIWILAMAPLIAILHPRKPSEHDIDMTILYRSHAEKIRTQP